MKAYRPSDCGDRHDGVRVDRGVTTRLLYVGRKRVGDGDRWKHWGRVLEIIYTVQTLVFHTLKLFILATCTQVKHLGI